MTARMLLSLFLDFFRCRKSLWHQHIDTSNLNVGLETEYDLNIYPYAKSFVMDKKLTNGINEQQSPELQVKMEDATGNLQHDVASCESDYDSVRHLELQQNSEPDGDENEDDDDDSNNAANHNHKDNQQDAGTEVTADADNDNAAKGDGDGDADDFGFDDPRLPAMII